MPQPTASELHLDQYLTDVSMLYMQQAEDFVCMKAQPVVPVMKQSDYYPVWTKNDFLRDEAQYRDGPTPSAGGGFGISNTQYTCKVLSFHKDLDRFVRKNADEQLRLEEVSARYVSRKLLIAAERKWAENFFGTGKWSNEATGGSGAYVQWNDAASNPAANIRTGIRTVLIATGYRPNTLILGYDVFDALVEHADFKDRVKYTSPESVTPAMIGAWFGIKNVYVTSAVYATNVENETAAYDFVEGKHALLAYVSEQPQKEEPSAMYCFGWTGLLEGADVSMVADPDAQVLGAAIGSFMIPELNHTKRIEGDFAFDFKQTGDDLGFFYYGIVA